MAPDKKDLSKVSKDREYSVVKSAAKREQQRFHLTKGQKAVLKTVSKRG